MLSNLNRSLFAALVLSLGFAVAAPIARADDPTDGTYAGFNGLYVGMTVEITGGEYAGQSGTITAVDEADDTLTVVDANGYNMYPRSGDIAASVTQASPTGCVGPLCVGDQVLVNVGPYEGGVGQMVNADVYNYTATVFVNGVYIIEDIRSLALSVRPAFLPPFPGYFPSCDYGVIFDAFRGCVIIPYGYPVPFYGYGYYPRIFPRYYGGYRGYGFPIREFPVGRGIFPGHIMPVGIGARMIGGGYRGGFGGRMNGGMPNRGGVNGGGRGPVGGGRGPMSTPARGGMNGGGMPNRGSMGGVGPVRQGPVGGGMPNRGPIGAGPGPVRPQTPMGGGMPNRGPIGPGPGPVMPRGPVGGGAIGGGRHR